MIDAARSQSGESSGGLCPQHRKEKIFQHGGEGGETTHVPLDVPSSAQRRSSTAEPQIPMGKETLVDKTTDVVTTVRGGGDFFKAQR